jgi:hypothetical protein
LKAHHKLGQVPEAIATVLTALQLESENLTLIGLITEWAPQSLKNQLEKEGTGKGTKREKMLAQQMTGQKVTIEIEEVNEEEEQERAAHEADQAKTAANLKAVTDHAHAEKTAREEAKRQRLEAASGEIPPPPITGWGGKNAITVLNEYMQKFHGDRKIEYHEDELASEDKQHMFCMIGDPISGFVQCGEGLGANKNEAKKNAATEAIKYLRQTMGASNANPNEMLLKPAPWRHAAEDVPPVNDVSANPSPVQVLNEFIKKMNVDIRTETTDLSETSPEAARVNKFSCEIFYGNEKLAVAEAESKKKANQMAALRALDMMRSDQHEEEERARYAPAALRGQL